MRKRIFEIIEVAREDDRASNAYDIFMMDMISLSLLPLMFKESTPLLHVIDRAALVIFNAEPDSFDDFFESVYWATVLLTTVGYGDIYPVTDIGRLIAMISSLFGIAIVALPAGIITAGYMKELEKDRPEEEQEALALRRHPALGQEADGHVNEEV